MKLAELLAQRKNIARRLQVIEKDVKENLTAVDVKQKEKKNVFLNQLVLDYRSLSEQQTRLSDQIGRLNSKLKVLGYDMSLTEAVAKREALKQLSNLYASMISVDPYSRRYEKDDNSLPVVDDESAVRKLRDSYAATARKLDVAIQATNWSVEVVQGFTGAEYPEEKDMEQVVIEESSVPEYPEEELVQEVSSLIVEEDHEVEQELSRHVAPQPQNVDKAKLKESLLRAQTTPRDRDPNCPIDGAGSGPNGVDIADMAYAVYDVYHSMSKLAEFLSSTGVERLEKVSTRVMQKFIDRNFQDGNEQYTPQL